MAGRLVDLSVAEPELPASLVLDSSVVIDWLAAVTRPSSPDAPPTPAQERAARLVARVRDEGAVGFVTSTGLNEVFHFVLKTGYRAALPDHPADLAARYPTVRRHTWEHLFKARSDLAKQTAIDLDRVRRLMTGNRVLVLQPDDLGPIPSGRTFDDELVRTMERYELDSSDAAILVEARRAGISAVASSDADFRRTRLDFDVYTWL